MSKSESPKVKNEAFLSQIEYSIHRYFETNYNSRVEKSYQDLVRHQEEEYKSRYKEYTLSNKYQSPGAELSKASAAEKYARAGKWNRQGAADFFQGMFNQSLKDPDIEHDFAILVGVTQAAFKSELGEKEYARLSRECSTKDLAADYVTSRFYQYTREHLAKTQGMVSKDSFFNAISSGLSHSTAGTIIRAMDISKSSALTSDLRTVGSSLSEQSFINGAVSFGVSIGTDVAVAALTGGASAGAGAVSKIATAGAVAFDVGKTGKQIINEVMSPGFTSYVSHQMYGDAMVLDTIQKKSVNLPSDVRVVRSVNQVLKRDMRPSVKSLHIDEDKIKLDSTRLQQQYRGNSSGLLSSVERSFDRNKVEYQKRAVPKWMQSKSESECFRLAAYFTSLASEMKENYRREIKVAGKNMSYQSVVQRAYDYAHAAAEKEVQREKTEVAKESVREVDVVSMRESVPVAGKDVEEKTVPLSPPPVAIPTAQYGGWGTFLAREERDGVSKHFSDFGMILSKLPDLMIGMFSGKIKGFGIKENLLPIGLMGTALIMGKRHPLLRLLLLGLGGGMIFKNLDNDVKRSSPVVPRRYPDEPLNPRIVNPIMKGNTLCAQIDGVPYVLTVSDAACTAYEQGYSSLNTLSNAVLRSFDRQGLSAAANTSSIIRDEELQELDSQMRIR